MSRPTLLCRLVALRRLVPASRLAAVTLTAAAALALLATGPRPTLGHGGDANLALSRERVDPGESLTVTGTDLGPLQQIPVQLVGPRAPVVLGVAQADEQGGFSLIVIIPADTPTGDYSIAVTTADEALVAVPLRVGPAPAPATGEVGGSLDAASADAASADAAGAASEAAGTLELGDSPLPADQTAGAGAASGTLEDPTATAAPLGSDLRGLAFFILVAGSFVLSAWAFGRPTHH